MQSSTKISSRPRGRPRSFDRDTALRAAAQRFRTHGFTGTTLDDLAEATGLSRPSLYAAFGDKHALYMAALDGVQAWIETSFAGLAERDLSLSDLLKSIFVPLIDGFLGGEAGPSGCIVINTATVEAVTDPVIRARLREIIELEDQGIAALLRQAGSPMPEAHGRLVTAVIHSLSVRARSGAPREELVTLARECSGMIAGGS